jgi:hypothetical protein
MRHVCRPRIPVVRKVKAEGAVKACRVRNARPLCFRACRGSAYCIAIAKKRTIVRMPIRDVQTSLVRHAGLALLLVGLAVPASAAPADCEPKWNCSGFFKLLCEADKARYRLQCEATPTFEAIGKGIEHLGREVEKEFCNLMTAGAYKQGRASCGVNAGLGHDDQGAYTFDPQRPDTKYRGSVPAGSVPPSDRALADLAALLAASKPHYYEYDFADAFGVSRFLPPSYRLGEAWPESAGPIATPTRAGVIRRADAQGGGSFLSIRGAKGKEGYGFHGGEDYVTMPNERIYSPVSGEIERLKPPGKRGLLGLEIRAPNGYTSTVFYVAPTKSIMEALADKSAGRPVRQPEVLRVTAGQTVIGHAQDLTLPGRYGATMTNHVHVTLEDAQKRRVAPSDPKVVIRPGPDGEHRVRRSVTKER